jgi:hypothetical protein
MQRKIAITLLSGCLASCGDSAAVPIQPSPPPIPSGVGIPICAGPLDTAVTLDGIVSETSPDGVRPVTGATVELFIGDSKPTAAGSNPAPARLSVTNDAGRYLLCFPQEALDGSGVTPSGQTFEVLARKDGYLSASKSFQYGYSKWDYGGMSVNLVLTRQ